LEKMGMLVALKDIDDRNGPRSDAPAVSLRDVTCTFSGSSGSKPYTAVQNINLDIADGEFVSVVGPTGCGKSTILNVTAGLIKPSKGSASIFGAPLVGGMNPQSGYLFQSEALMPWRTTVQNVMLGLEYRGVDVATAKDRAAWWLETVGLGQFHDHYPHQLSGGQRKRVALAQTLITDPKIILMDEPFSALDIQTRQLMENELLDLWAADRKAVIFVTHDLEEAISMSDRVVVLSAGPASCIVGEFSIDLPRPRDVSEIRLTSGFLDVHKAIWATLKEEVLKTYGKRSARR